MTEQAAEKKTAVEQSSAENTTAEWASTPQSSTPKATALKSSTGESAAPESSTEQPQTPALAGPVARPNERPAAHPSNSPTPRPAPSPAIENDNPAPQPDVFVPDEMNSTKSVTARARFSAMLGPAFVAAVAYVDPGNVAANITSGARYGYLLVWVLVLANAMSVLIQYQSAKLGVVTGKSLPQLLGERMQSGPRILFFAQAEVIAIATDLAEVIGGAIALKLLFNLPLFIGGCVIGAVSTVLLFFQGGHTHRVFEKMIIGLLLVITFGFIAGLFIDPPAPGAVAAGLIPHFTGTDSVLMASSMLGATVMPHAIYLHSTLVNDHYEPGEERPSKRRQLKASKVDVVWALLLAGTVNLSLLILAANSLYGMTGTDSIEGAQQAIVHVLGPVIGVIFSIGLLASSLSSTSVGTYAGAEIMRGLLHVQAPMWACRVITLVPALVVLWFSSNPTEALVIGQVILSIGIPFAIIPLMHYTGDRALMGEFTDGLVKKALFRLIAVLIIALNVLLVFLTLTGRA